MIEDVDLMPFFRIPVDKMPKYLSESLPKELPFSPGDTHFEHVAPAIARSRLELGI